MYLKFEEFPKVHAFSTVRDIADGAHQSENTE